MDTHFYLLMILVFSVMAANNGRRGEPSPVDETRAAERRRKFRAAAPLWVSLAVFYFAAGAALVLVGLFLDLAAGRALWTIGTMAAIPALATAAVLLGWIGVRLFRDKGLPGRLARAWSAAVSEFAAPYLDEPKPKAARADHDFD